MRIPVHLLLGLNVAGACHGTGPVATHAPRPLPSVTVHLDAAIPVAADASTVDAMAPVHERRTDLVCELRVGSVAHDGRGNTISLFRVRPYGVPLMVSIPSPPQRYRYDDEGRVIENPNGQFTHHPDGTTTFVHVPHDARSGHGTWTRAVVFDPAHRLVVDGAQRYTYDGEGRLTRIDDGGYYLAYHYARDGTCRVSSNQTNDDVMCDASLAAVVFDAQHRSVMDRYVDCGSTETPHTLRYHYDAEGRIDRIGVDFLNDGTTDAVIALRYECGQ